MFQLAYFYSLMDLLSLDKFISPLFSAWAYQVEIKAYLSTSAQLDKIISQKERWLMSFANSEKPPKYDITMDMKCRITAYILMANFYNSRLNTDKLNFHVKF